MVNFSREELTKLDDEELHSVITTAEDILSERESESLFEDEDAENDKQEEKNNEKWGNSLFDEDLGLPIIDLGL